MRLLSLMLAGSLLVSCTNGQTLPQSERAAAKVTLEKKTRHYVVNVTEGTPEDTGREYARALKDTPWARHIDAYLSEFVGGYSQLLGMTESQFYGFLRGRAEDLLPSLSEAHRKELMAFAAAGAGTEVSVTNDGLLSQDEIVILSFLPEVIRPSACSAISVFGALAANGGNLVGRVLDWNSGKDGVLNNLNAVVIRKGEAGTTVSIGYLGFLPVLTGVNSNGIFVAEFDSEYGATLETAGRRSFPYDLRAALESARAIADVTGTLAAPQLRYPFAFNAIVADGRETVALENASPNGEHGADLRTASSTLLDGVTWEFSNALAMVNSNVLKGHFDNHTMDPANTGRWESYRKNLAAAAADGSVTLAEVEELITYHKRPDQIDSLNEGEIYNRSTQYMTLWDSSAKTLKVWFRMPEDKLPPLEPEFEEISLPW